MGLVAVVRSLSFNPAVMGAIGSFNQGSLI